MVDVVLPGSARLGHVQDGARGVRVGGGCVIVAKADTNCERQLGWRVWGDNYDTGGIIVVVVVINFDSRDCQPRLSRIYLGPRMDHEGIAQCAPTTSTIYTTDRHNHIEKRRGGLDEYSMPMPFDGDGGWGKCTLRSRTLGTSSVGSSSYAIYEFTLPEPYYSLSLGLGQQLEFCCLGPGDEICTGSFYPYDGSAAGAVGGSGSAENKRRKGGAGATAGVVRVVLPTDKVADEGNSKFMEVLRDDLRPGDEVAIRPGKTHLSYRGKHVPVTDMVYVAYGLGIVPVLDQIRAITPKGSSSVTLSSVLWFNDNRDDFDLAMDDLEAEYMKYPGKLAVSCIMDDVLTHPLEGNREVEESVPYFNAGTMAVVCGPKRFAEKVRGYLMRRGYPENCICVLP